MKGDYFVLVFKNLKHRGIRSWLTILGIFIGIAAVVSLISLGNALQIAVSNQFGISQTELITIEAGGISGLGPPGSSVVEPLTEKDLRGIERLSSVKRAVGRNIASVKVEYNDNLVFTYVSDMPDGDDRDFVYEQLDEEPVAGRFLKDSDSGKVFLGYNFYADKVGLQKKVALGRKVLLNDKSFEVIGILGKKGSFIFDNVVFVNSDDFEEIVGEREGISLIVAQPKDKDELEKVKEDIEKLLRKTRDVDKGEENFRVSTPEGVLATVNGILAGINIFIVIVASISIFIGCIGIVNTMTTSVLERKKDIGIMKAVGAKNQHIFLQFLIESGFLGLIGGICGVIFGISLGAFGIVMINNFLGDGLEIVVDYALILFSLAGSFVIGSISGVVPAMKASRQEPVEVLRS